MFHLARVLCPMNDCFHNVPEYYRNINTDISITYHIYCIVVLYNKFALYILYNIHWVLSLSLLVSYYVYLVWYQSSSTHMHYVSYLIIQVKAQEAHSI